MYFHKCVPTVLKTARAIPHDVEPTFDAAIAYVAKNGK